MIAALVVCAAGVALDWYLTERYLERAAQRTGERLEERIDRERRGR